MSRGQYTSVGRSGRGGWGGRGWGGRGYGGGGFGLGGLGYGLGYGVPFGYGGYGGYGSYGSYGLGMPFGYGYGYGASPYYSYARPYLDIADNGVVYDTGGYYMTTPSFYGGTFVGSPYANSPTPHWRSRRFAENRRTRRVHHILGAY